MNKKYVVILEDFYDRFEDELNIYHKRGYILFNSGTVFSEGVAAFYAVMLLKESE